MDDFTFISPTDKEKRLGPDFEDLLSGKVADIDVSLTKALRAKYPELNLTTVANVPLLYFAAAGYAVADLDTETDSIFRWRGWVPPYERGGHGYISDATFFGKYHYQWANEHYILYLCTLGPVQLQYVLKEPAEGETQVSHCAATDALIKAAAEALSGDPTKYIYVYDRYWYRSTALYEEVEKASWDNVILSPKTKHALTKVSNDFFDSREQYEKYGVAWKRGLIWHGPAGNGKTISIKALMHDLQRRDPPVPTLYVKSAPYTYDIGNIFYQARAMSPCLLVLEDIETIVNPGTRSYFFNEVDGLENNNGILMVASTNYLNRLDPGLANRPSRFDRKYLFPKPAQHERILYAKYWRQKILKRSKDIDFPEMLCPAIADITDDFSFAYMQEAFVATLLAIARGDSDEDTDELPIVFADPSMRKLVGSASGAREDGSKRKAEAPPPYVTYRLDYASEDNEKGGDDDDKLNRYRFWRVIKEQVRALRDDMKSKAPSEEETVNHELLDELKALRIAQTAAAEPPSSKRGKPVYSKRPDKRTDMGPPVAATGWRPDFGPGGQFWYLEGEQNCDFNGRTGSSFGFLSKYP